jgi:XTP/dITP diphosphohydrolase
MPKLLIASNNPDKIHEFRALLDGSGWDVVAPADLGIAIDVDETGATYSDNARLKAEAFARASGLPALADDSGLEVDVLHGEPGPLHHLLGWDGGDQAERNQRLLDALRDVPPEQRTGRYVAVLVVHFPEGRVLEAEGIEEGVIAAAPSDGSTGFGYDPIFYLPELGKTVAELTLAEKNRISHRALAMQKLLPRLLEAASQ